jgi:excisionase family DNA binding protein
MIPQDFFLTPDEAAAILRVPLSWLYRRTSKNQIPHRKLGRHLRFSRDELLLWANAHRVGPVTQQDEADTFTKTYPHDAVGIT